ncbi:ATP-binding protein [Paenisporosarcina sp. TG20]|uniref:ATP-binding protein n=1 Tax=Paenisporosarcina sp. TG20 TaxID=1211706 RepID=UPI0002E72687|nr:ATP-binding protein [Paenisporosarcina sp. TG20]
MNNLFSYNITEIFNFLFWDDKDSVIIFEKGKGIIKINKMAIDLFSNHNVDDYDLVKLMDKSSLMIWNEFLQKAKTSNLEKCKIELYHPTEGRTPYYLEGCYNQSNSQYVIRFKQLPNLLPNSDNGSDSLNYQSVFKYAPFGMILTTIGGKVIGANLKVEPFFNIPTSELIGENLHSLFDLFMDSTCDFPNFFKVLESKGSAKVIVTKLDEKGNQKFFQLTSQLNKSDGIYITVIQEDTENIQLKKQVDHFRSLSTLGELAASIAHEIRNPMTSLKGFTQLLNHQVTEEGSQYLTIINSELNRMESILNEFLVLSKPGDRTFRYTSISTLISQVVDFMYPQGILKNIEIEFISWEKNSDCILGDSFGLKKVLMNIIKNAIEVMPNGGKIIITQTLYKNNQVRISVKDQGIGMNSDQMSKIFQPFYTTKELGTGLGLAHTVQIIEDHDGYIEVESEINEGTTFHLFFPVYQLDQLKDNSVLDLNFVESSR